MTSPLAGPPRSIRSSVEHMALARSQRSVIALPGSQSRIEALAVSTARLRAGAGDASGERIGVRCRAAIRATWPLADIAGAAAVSAILRDANWRSTAATAVETAR